MTVGANDNGERVRIELSDLSAHQAERVLLALQDVSPAAPGDVLN
ncbi:hypothetical protein ACFV3E_40775 [Streptomyces sp. NPDC059718]